MSSAYDKKWETKDKVGCAVYVLFAIAVMIFAFSILTKDDRQAEKDQIESLQLKRDELLSDFYGMDEEARIEAFKSLRHDESLWDQLIQELNTNGSPGLAAAFCGYSTELTNAAVTWADNHGYKIIAYSRGVDTWYRSVPTDQAP